MLVRRASVGFDHGREAVKILDQIKHGLAAGCADECLDVSIARSDRCAQTRELGIGLDRNPVPTLEIERERGVVVNRVPRSDIDIEAIAAAAEAAHQVEVLEPLGIRDGRLGHASGPQPERSRTCCSASTTGAYHLSSS
ncbi:MAG: hypothetical protein E6G76_14560 [Alphaproteobacteria bacterium]|nr:MAG: hypothetical protein E6G76_14560 [Alphaproteobacteria bacterium]